ncbi:hypothetical protein GCM10025787_03410 [Saccharopolyspora rosea]|uniref:Uncharacterized protein n=2 Tax=Saccharopolyspora rosea TaxID=524884 RepID=A0ABW3FPF6_9PSEU
MTTLSARTADVAAWLATQPLDELPPLANIRISSDWAAVAKNVAAEVQLGAGSDLIALAKWAEHLGTTVTVHPRNGYLNAAIVVPIGDHKLVLWNHIEGRSRTVLEHRRGAPITLGSVEIPPSVLWQAARLLEETEDVYGEEWR